MAAREGGLLLNGALAQSLDSGAIVTAGAGNEESARWCAISCNMVRHSGLYLRDQLEDRAMFALNRLLLFICFRHAP